MLRDLWNDLRFRLRALFDRAAVERELEEELRFHTERLTEKLQNDGAASGDAARRALLELGGVEQVKESVRDARGVRWLEELAGDLRLTGRGVRRQPLFTLSVVALIALGIGPNAAIFSVVNHLLLEPLPFRDGNRMVLLTATAGSGQLLISRTMKDVDSWRARAHEVEAITPLQSRQFVFGDTLRGSTERIWGDVLPPGATEFVGVRPLLGRDIEPSDTLSDAGPAALLSYALWQRAFGGRPDAIGRTIVLDQVQYVVIGVMPEMFAVPFMRPAQVYPAWRNVRPSEEVLAIAKLRRGATVADADRELAAIFKDLDKTRSEDVPRVERAVDRVETSVKRSIYLAFGAVGLVVLIACANVAHLMVSRAWTRHREFTIRAAMGAARARLVRQVLVESVALSLTGGVIGVAVALGTLRLLSTQWQIARYMAGVRLEPVVLGWIVAISVIVGVLSGMAPAMFVSGNRLGDALKSGGHAVAGSNTSKRLRRALVVGELSLSVVLLVLSGLLARTITSMQRADVGFQSHGLYGVSVALVGKPFADSVVRHAAVENTLERVRAVLGVRQAALVERLLPDFMIWTGQLEIDGHPLLASDSLSITHVALGDPAYFSFMGLHFVEGRPYARFAALTDGIGMDELVVNESFARRFWPPGGAVGGRIRHGPGAWSTIVGVVSDVRVPGMGPRSVSAQFYQAMGVSPYHAMIAVRSDLPQARILSAISDAIHSANPAIKVGRAESADDDIAGWRAMHAFTLRLIGGFAILALILAAFGLHATIAYSVGQRRREIGLRIALGAQARDVMGLVLGEGVLLAMWGVLVGAAGGIVAARTMRALLYGVTLADPVTLSVVAVLLTAVAMLASYVPARRAVGVDPVETLRAE